MTLHLYYFVLASLTGIITVVSCQSAQSAQGVSVLFQARHQVGVIFEGEART